ncbi:S1 family serine peptidase [Veronia pacifica]|uniref:Peptidase S1 domain-containing protein n=1 Tax=Veronia pacifica TaxID=1080227 RepID=A0A1C3EG78_9GAMM|nr:serine protease [Veronia pacifica]ODA32230.1 hypothetical protein A8L45_13625 [Veronia pacifica]
MIFRKFDSAFFAFSFLILILISGTVQSNADVRVIGGKDADKEKYPFIAHLSTPEYSSEPFCGATYIGGKKVLTAAHCVVAADYDDTFLEVLMITIGDYDVTKKETEKQFSVERIVIHPGYDSQTLANDIAIIFLEKEPVGIDEASLPKMNMKNVFNSKTVLTVAGWGVTDEGNVSDILQEVDVNFVSDKLCRTSYEDYLMTGKTICAGDIIWGGIDACQGDSGGPLFYTDLDGTLVQTGIVSWGIGCALAEYPGVYANTGAHLSFIESPDKFLDGQITFVSDDTKSPNVPLGLVKYPITLQNTSDSVANVTSLYIDDGQLLTNPCKQALEPNQSCTIDTTLQVKTGRTIYEATAYTETASAPSYLPIDITGIGKDNVDNEDFASLKLPSVIVPLGKNPWSISDGQMKAVPSAGDGYSMTMLDKFPKGTLSFTAKNNTAFAGLFIYVNQKEVISYFTGEKNINLKLDQESNFVEFYYEGLPANENFGETVAVRDMKFKAGNIGLLSFVILIFFAYNRKIRNL